MAPFPAPAPHWQNASRRAAPRKSATKKCNNLLPIGRSSSTFVLKAPIPEYAPHVRLLRNRVAARSSNSAIGARCERSENQGEQLIDTLNAAWVLRGAKAARGREKPAAVASRPENPPQGTENIEFAPGNFYPMKQWTGPGGFRAYGIRTRSNSQGSRRFRAPVMRTSQAGARSGAARDVLFPAPSKVSEPRKP